MKIPAFKKPMFYRLEGKKVIPMGDNALEAAREWGVIYGKNRIKQTRKGNVLVSTIFLFFDHGMWSNEPILFETMVFKGEKTLNDGERYSTYDDALRGHARYCRRYIKRKKKPL